MAIGQLDIRPVKIFKVLKRTRRRGKQMHKQKGFSLIELLIVVAIILIIAAIAIPNLLRARIAANESSAAASVRTIATGELTYQTAYGGYVTSLDQLGPDTANGCTTPSSANACIIDYQLAHATSTLPKSGYAFTAASAVALQYFISAVPATSGSSGIKNFCAVEDNVVRFDGSAAATDHNDCLKKTAIGN